MAGNNEIIEFGKEVKELNILIKDQIELLKKVGDTIKTSYKALPSELLKQLKEQNNLELQAEKLRQESIKSQQKLEELAKKQIQTARESQRLAEQNSKNETRLLKEKEAQNARTMKSHNDFVNAINRQKKAQEQANKAQERQNKLITEASRPYIQLQNKWREAQKNLADLVVSQGANARATVLQRKEFELLDKQIRSVDSITKNYSKNVGNYSSAITGGLGSLMGAFGVVGGVTAGITVLKDAFNIIREFDSQMINVQKTTGLTNIELTDLKDSVVALSKELGIVSSAKLGEYMAVAGQLGVKGKQNLLSFTEAMAQLETASTIAGEQGASEMARFLTLVDGGVQNVKSFGNEVVNLGNNFAATESEILSNATRIAQSTGVYNLGRQQVLAYATATKAVGVEAELVGSTMGRTLAVFEKAIRTGENLSTITKILGTNQQELSERFKTDASGVLQDYIKALNNTYKAGGSVNEQLEAIGITAVRDQAVISSLASKGYAVLEDAMIKVTEAGNAMGDEFENASRKINNKIESLKVNWSNFILNIDKGDGAISEFVSRSITSLNKLISALDRLNTSWSQIWENARTEGETLGTREAEKFLNINKDSESRMNAIKKVATEIKDTEKELEELRQKESEIASSNALNRFVLAKSAKWYKEQIELKENYLGQYKGYIKRLQDENANEAITSSGLGGSNSGATQTTTTTSTELTNKQISDAKRLEEERLRNIAENNKLIETSKIEHERNIDLINAKTDGERIGAQLKYNEDYKKILKLNYNEEVRQAQGNNEKLILAKTKYNAEIRKLEDDSIKIANDAREKQYQNALKLANMIEDNDSKNAMKSTLMTAKSEQDKAQIKIKYIDSQRQALERDQEQALERIQKGSEEELIILEEYRQKRIDLDNEEKQILIDNAKKAQEQIKGYLSKFTDMGNFGFSSLNIFTTIEENGKSMFENMLDNAKDWKQQMALIIGSVGEVMKDVMGAMQDASRARHENELAQAQASYETSLLFAGDSAEAREKLEQELAEKQKEIRKKQAESDKKYSIMNAIINTAQAVTAMLAVGPWGIPLSIFAGAMGAIQIATIASTPIPEFWTGTDNAPKGWAWTQERGAEVITDKQGNVKTYGNNKGAQLTFLESGDKVYKSREDYFNRELNGILTSSNIGYGDIQVNNEFDYEEFERIAKNNKSNTAIFIDENGFNTRVTRKNNRQQLKNNYARG